MSIYASINDYGFLVTPFAVVKKGVVTDEVVFLRADEEHEHTIANADVKLDPKTGKILQDRVMARRRSEFVNVPLDEVTLMDVSPKQLVGVAAGADPLPGARRRQPRADGLQHAAPGRAADPPARRRWWRTGMEPYVARNSGMMLVAEEDGVVEYADGTRIVVRYGSGNSARVVEYPLRKYFGLNERTCLNQTPIIKAGDKVTAGQVLTEGAATRARRTGAGQQRPGRVHELGRLQLRGRHPGQRAVGARGHLHLDPHRGVLGAKSARPSWGARRSRATSPTSRKPPCATSTTTAWSASARASSPATSWSARSRPRARASCPARRSCCTPSSAARAKT